MGLKEYFSKICAYNGIQIPNIAQFDAFDICQHLIQLNMQDSQNEDGDTALILGAGFGNVSICQSLIDAGANVTLQDKNGGSPLHYAAAHSHRPVCDILIKAGADVNLLNNKGHSPLTGAALYGNFDICKALVKAGANVNHQTNTGNTALHSCARSDLTYNAHRNTMVFLMKECADKSVHVQNNKSGQSVVDLYNENMCKKYKNDIRSAQKEKLLQILKSASLPDTDITSSDLDIPYAITARGKRVEKAYIEALKEGTIEVNLGMLKVIGQEGVGKTCLINACIGKKFNNNHEITDGIAVIKTVRTKAEEQKWAEDLTEDCGNPNSLYRKLAEKNISKIIEVDEESVVEEDGAAAESKHYVSMENVKAATKNRTVKTEQHGKPGTPTRTEDVSKMSIAEGTKTSSLEQEWDKDIVQKIFAKEEVEQSPVENTFNIWDHGGQVIYQGIHRIFITSEAVYVVVFDLSKNLEDLAKFIDSNWEERDHHWTNLQFILSSILSVYSHSRILTESIEKEVNFPAILIVGTHKGKLGNTEKEQNDEADKVLKKIEDVLIGKPYEKHVYGYYAVENSRETTDESFSDLKEVIQDLMNHLKKSIPLKWMRFRCELYNMREDKLICSLDEVEVLARKNKIDENQQSILLNFLYDLGDIIYLPDNKLLRRQVVLDPMSLVTLVTAFITVVPPKFPTAMFREAFRNLDKGILDEMLLKKLWKKERIDSEKFQYFVDLMIRLGFICERMTSTKQESTSTKSVVKRSFLVPMRLAFGTSSSSEVKSVHDDDYHSISIYYDLCGYLPDVLFPYLVIDCLNEYQTKTGDDPILLHNYAELYVDHCHNVILTLVRVLTKQNERKFLLKATIQGRKALDETTTTECEPSPEACKRVLSTLEKSFRHSKDGGRRGIAFHRCIPCVCSEAFEKKHMQNLGDFKNEILPCKRKHMNVKRYKRLFADTPTADLGATYDTPLVADTITYELMMDLVQHIGYEWETLAVYLGFTSENLYRFKHDNRDNIQGAMFSMLDTWRKKISCAGKSWNVQLTEALRKVKRNDLADKIEINKANSDWPTRRPTRECTTEATWTQPISATSVPGKTLSESLCATNLLTVYLESIKGPPYPQYVANIFQNIFCGKDVVHANNLPQQNDTFKELVELIREIGFTIKALEQTSLTLHLSTLHLRALFLIWSLYKSGRLLKCLVKVLFPKEHWSECIVEWNVRVDRNQYKLVCMKLEEELLTPITSTATLPTEHSTEHLEKLIVDVDLFWDTYGNINLLKLLLYEFQNRIPLAKIQRAKDACNLFNLLVGPGILSKSDVTVLIEAVYLCALVGLEPQIQDRVPSFEGFEKFVVCKFSKNRQNLINFGFEISDETMEKIDDWYNVDSADKWDLIFRIERMGKLQSLIATLKKEKMLTEHRVLTS